MTATHSPYGRPPSGATGRRLLLAVRAVLFDYGHTLVDFQRAEKALVTAYAVIRERLLGEVEEEIPGAEELARHVTGAMDDLVRRSYEEDRLQELDVVEILVEALSGLGITVSSGLARELAALDHRAFSDSITATADTLAALDELAARYRLGLVSNITLIPELVTADLGAIGLAPFFGAVALSSALGVRKPDPAIFRWALERLGVLPEEAVFVGDRLRDDIAGARGVGMRTILCRRFRDELDGPEREEALRMGGRAVRGLRPDHAIGSLDELPPLLASM